MAYLRLDKKYIAAGDTFRLSAIGNAGDEIDYTIAAPNLTPADIGATSLAGSIVVGNNGSGFIDFQTSTEAPTGEDFVKVDISSPGKTDVSIRIYADEHYIIVDTLDEKIDLGDTFNIWRKKTNGFLAKIQHLLSGTYGYNSQTIIANGDYDCYALSFLATSENEEWYDVAIDGITQNPRESFTIDVEDNKICFKEAPPKDASISIIHKFEFGSTISYDGFDTVVPSDLLGEPMDWDTNGSGDVTIYGDLKVNGSYPNSLLIDAYSLYEYTLTKGTPVKLVGGFEGDALVVDANADDYPYPEGVYDKPIIGVVAEDLEPNTKGKVLMGGELENVNVSRYNVGDILYLFDSNAPVPPPIWYGTEPDVTRGIYRDVVYPVGMVTKASSARGEADGKMLVFLHGGSSLTGTGGSTNLLYETTVADNVGSVEVGGIEAGTTAGSLKTKTIIGVLDDILFPTIDPFVSIQPSVNVTVNKSSYKETGSEEAINIEARYNPGQITNGDGSSYVQLKGDTIANAYRFTVNGIESYVQGNAGDTNATVSSYVHQYTNGINRFNCVVTHDTGTDPYYDNKSNESNILDNQRLSGTLTDPSEYRIEAVYPIFWFTSSSPINASSVVSTILNDDEVNKEVTSSNGTITIPYNLNQEYIAIAYPSSSPTKTYYSTSKKDDATVDSIFATDTLNITSPDGYWSDISYTIHTLLLSTTSTNPNIELRNEE